MADETIQDLLSVFDRMPADEQREAVSAILRRAVELEVPPLDDESIDRIADESFLEYDSREAAGAEG